MVIGLEVHAQVTSKSKTLFGAPTDFGAEPNTQVSLVDAANARHAAGAERVCRRTGGEDRAWSSTRRSTKRSVFERKNYFYPDLPQGYQISQFLHPIVGKGESKSTCPTAPPK